MCGGRFCVSQIVNYELNYISESPPSKLLCLLQIVSISLITFPKIFHFIYRQFWTILNSLEPFSKVWIKFVRFLSRIPCFSENVVTGKILLRTCYSSYIDIFRPFGTISEVFEVSSAVDSVIPFFPESGEDKAYWSLIVE